MFFDKKSILLKNLSLVGSKESSPYKNWTIPPSESLTVKSYSTFKLSKCFIKHLCKYPLLDVLTAVSISPYLPAMQWKKNYWLLKPVKNLSAIKPEDRGLGSYATNEGSVFPVIIIGTLFPYNYCWPSIIDTWEWFTFDPLAPVTVIILKLFVGNFLTKLGKQFSMIFELFSCRWCLY